MVAAHGDPPAVARQRVRRALRKFRGETDLSQGDVARRLEWSLSKVQRIEAGDVGVSATDLLALLEVYGVDDPARVAKLAEDARISRRQRYVTPQAFRDHLPSGLLELIQFEKEARSVRVYQPQTFPGVLQTPAVAEAILSWGGRLSDRERQVRYDVRRARRSELIDHHGGPEFFFVLDESVIKRPVHDRKVTAAQLEDLVVSAARPWVHIRIVPFAKGAHWPGLGAFQILEPEDVDNEAVLYREMSSRDEVVHDADEVRFYLERFNEAWAEALSEEQTVRAIVAETTQLRAAVDH